MTKEQMSRNSLQFDNILMNGKRGEMEKAGVTCPCAVFLALTARLIRNVYLHRSVDSKHLCIASQVAPCFAPSQRHSIAGANGTRAHVTYLPY